MIRKFTIKTLKALQQSGSIRGFRLPEKKIDRKILLNKKGKQWYWISAILSDQATEWNLKVDIELAFHATRRWRFDFAIPSIRLAVEYEGIFSEKSRHTTFKGYTGDTEKYNAATLSGWRVIRLTAENYKTLPAQLKILELMPNLHLNRLQKGRNNIAEIWVSQNFEKEFLKQFLDIEIDVLTITAERTVLADNTIYYKLKLPADKYEQLRKAIMVTIAKPNEQNKN